MKRMGITPGRRAFLRNAVTAAPAAAAIATGLAGTTVSKIAQAANAQAYVPRYFSDAEWITLHALLDRMIPADDTGPGALEAGVAEFIDRQMDTPYGQGGLWYMQGPFVKDASPLMGYQLPYSPRELYRSALLGLERAIQHKYGKRFDELDVATQDSTITELEKGQLSIGEVPPADFFDQLLKNTREGYFSDPVHGGNKGMAAWKMINFPGARADYMDAVEQYGKPYKLPPVSIA